MNNIKYQHSTRKTTHVSQKIFYFPRRSKYRSQNRNVIVELLRPPKTVRGPVISLLKSGSGQTRLTLDPAVYANICLYAMRIFRWLFVHGIYARIQMQRRTRGTGTPVFCVRHDDPLSFLSHLRQRYVQFTKTHTYCTYAHVPRA